MYRGQMCTCHDFTSSLMAVAFAAMMVAFRFRLQFFPDLVAVSVAEKPPCRSDPGFIIRDLVALHAFTLPNHWFLLWIVDSVHYGQNFLVIILIRRWAVRFEFIPDRFFIVRAIKSESLANPINAFLD